MPPRAILHVDMDAFYASIEQRDRPELRDRPVIVGADPRGGRGRGVVSTASYEARRFGVTSAMPISKAYRLCPHGAFLPVDMEKYGRVSDEVMEILRRVTDQVEPVSIDEAFLDVTASRRALGEAVVIARSLKQAIHMETRLSASVGVATSKLVAKIASDLRKPDGLVVVEPATEAAFLAPLPVRRLWGIGPTMETQLLKAGLRTIGELAAASPGALARRIGSHGLDLQALARGIDERAVEGAPADAKSIGKEHTFDQDTDDVRLLRQTLLDLADAVGRRARAESCRGRTITLKYRDASFQTWTRARTLRESTDAGADVFSAAWDLFTKLHEGRHVRLLGVSLSGFGAGAQMALFARPTPPGERIRDAVAERFGKDALIRASLLPNSQGNVPRRSRKHR